MAKFDVAIIGAGPSGSATAIALARRGYAVALVDKERFPREKLCGDFVNPINLPIFRALGVEQQILAEDHERVTAFRVTSFLTGEAEAPLPSVDKQTLFGLGMRRASLDSILLQQAEKEGAAAFQDARVGELKRESQAWRLQVDQGGAREELRARILIGADGRNSWVAHRLGLSSPAATQGRALGLQVRLKRARSLAGKVEIHLFPGGYAGVVGVGGDVINLCLAVRKETLPAGQPMDSLWNAALPRNPNLEEILCTSERVGKTRSIYPIYFSPRRSVGDGVLLVGDAARVSEPVTGEGIYFALRSGLLAADAADRAFRFMDFSAAQLGTYEQACRRLFRARRGLNALLRFLIYRPALFASLIRLSATKRRLVESMIRAICLPEPAP